MTAPVHKMGVRRAGVACDLTGSFLAVDSVHFFQLVCSIDELDPLEKGKLTVT